MLLLRYCRFSFDMLYTVKIYERNGSVYSMAEDDRCIVNNGKQLIVEANGERFLCYAIKTHLVTEIDRLEDLVRDYAAPVLRQGDVLFLSEKMVACTQGRAIPMETIHPGFFARLLSRFVTRSAYGIGLSMPETMQCAICECGLVRILLAAFCGAVGKLFGRRGWFYHVAGAKAAGIDGPCSCTMPPYDKYVVLTPSEPDHTARKAAKIMEGISVLIVDLNDLGGRILGASRPDMDQRRLLELLRQNPLGQGRQRTPMGILRPMTR